MTNEQEVIKRLNFHKEYARLSSNRVVISETDLETVLNMLKEKDKEIEELKQALARNIAKNFTSSMKESAKSKEDLEMLNKGWQIELEKKDKQINLIINAVCFDFDGVIHKYSKGWQDGSIYDKANPEMLDLMLVLQKLDIPVFICSTRKPEQIIEWWNKQGFWADAIKIKDNETFWKDTKFIGVTNRKLPAQLYIDDRAYKYTGQTVKQFMLDNSEDLEE